MALPLFYCLFFCWDTVLEYGYEEKKAIIDGALVRDILNDHENGRLLALIAHSASPHGTKMIDGGHALPSTALTGTLDVVVENERSQEARHERKSNGVPAADDQPVNRGMHGGMSVSRPSTRGRPKSLDEALKAMAEALDSGRS